MITLPEVVADSYRAEVATSATRLPAPILDTPRSVGVVTRQLIEDRAIVDPREAVQNVSGVQRTADLTFPPFRHTSLPKVCAYSRQCNRPHKVAVYPSPHVVSDGSIKHPHT